MARAKKSKQTPSRKRREEIPPGATRQALDRPVEPGGGPPGSGAGPRHAAGDEGSDIEATGYHDMREVISPEEPLEEGPPYAGISGGAVGGTPAEGRSTGGRTGHGLSPGSSHRGNSTIGAGDRESAKARKRAQPGRRRAKP